MFVSLPSGYGESMIFQVLLFCSSYLMSCVNPPVDASHITVPAVVVVSPLISLMADQVARLSDKVGKPGSVVSVGTGGIVPSLGSLGAQSVTHLLGSPESLLGNPQWRSIFTGELGKRVVAVVVEEVHVIAKWSVTDDGPVGCEMHQCAMPPITKGQSAPM